MYFSSEDEASSTAITVWAILSLQSFKLFVFQKGETIIIYREEFIRDATITNRVHH